ncbi:hypothetical protein [Xenorhabdus szentirmaii]|uniref:hypothetical protein n=1 Tax=Xenorhabdus szentirmaii TaxID=290112 RepID=UPI00198772E9|nr:hypothetical protein [Xenorhabdus sp. 5]MBD2826691.1 hypothetical protein [Xenorhabdus sp. 5]
MSKQPGKRTNLIASTDEAWENGELGRSEYHIKLSDVVTEELIIKLWTYLLKMNNYQTCFGGFSFM